MTQYVYVRSEPQLWTVGFYTPSGKWEPESDHSTPAEAAKRVNYLNGGARNLGTMEEQMAAMEADAESDGRDL